MRAFIQMSTSFNENFPWIFSENGPFDTVVVDTESKQAKNENVRKFAKKILYLTNDHYNEAANVMSRPLRFGKFEAWLERNAVELRTDAQVESALFNGTQTSILLDLADKNRYKLVRWPPSIVLNQNPFRIRMATILSKRAITLADLSSMLQAPIEKCQICLNTFESLGLLAINQIEMSPPDRERSATGNASLGLIASIRRRFGL